METLSQEKGILNYMKSGMGITPIDALDLFGCFRLSARISDLRKKGYLIRTDMVVKNGKRVARYSLETLED